MRIASNSTLFTNLTIGVSSIAGASASSISRGAVSTLSSFRATSSSSAIDSSFASSRFMYSAITTASFSSWTTMMSLLMLV